MASAFTFNADEILNRLRTPIIIKTDSDKYGCVALWDTGATNSCVPKDVINRLNLKDVGVRKAHTPSGVGEFKLYIW